MTPGARLAAAIEILSEIDQGLKPADVVIGSYFRNRRYAGSKDRRWVTARIYNLMRRKARVEWWLEQSQADDKSSARARLLADLALDAEKEGLDLERLFSGARHCPDAMTEPERAVAKALFGQSLTHPDQPDWVMGEFPAWLEQPLRTLWGDDLGRQLTGLNQPAKLDLRVNRLKTTRDAVLADLRADGLEANPSPLSSDGIRVEGHPRLGGMSAFRDGLIEVQDEGSQIAARLAGAEPGMKVVDYCAGAGGKSLAMAADMGQNGRAKGWITACDVAFNRLRKLEDRAKRAGVRNIRTRVLKSDQDPWLMDNQGYAERVLVDAPCTGIGAWRRNADAKWRMTPEFAADMLSRQRRVLSNAAGLVKPGGRMTYVTCSVIAEENEHQIDAFLDKHQDFKPLDIRDIWAERLPETDCPTNEPVLRLTPADHGTDGFFVSVLERKA